MRLKGDSAGCGSSDVQIWWENEALFMNRDEISYLILYVVQSALLRVQFKVKRKTKGQIKSCGKRWSPSSRQWLKITTNRRRMCLVWKYSSCSTVRKKKMSCFPVPLSPQPTFHNHLLHPLNSIIFTSCAHPIHPLLSCDLRDTQVLIKRVLNPSLHGSAQQKVCTDVQRKSGCKQQLRREFSASSPHNWAEIGGLSAEAKTAEKEWGRKWTNFKEPQAAVWNFLVTFDSKDRLCSNTFYVWWFILGTGAKKPYLKFYELNKFIRIDN